MAMNDVFENYGIENPASWLDLERKNEVPTDSRVWRELVDTLGDDRAESAKTKRVLENCALRFEKDTLSQDTSLRKFLNVLRDDVSLYLVDESAILLVRSDNPFINGFYLKMTNNDRIELCGLFRTPFYALLTSWGKNPDRVNAHMARQFLCDAVQKVLEVDKLMSNFFG